jgi:hypothetical protein
MAKELTYEELLKELDNLPNIERKINDKTNKQELSRKRSTFLGGGRRR